VPLLQLTEPGTVPKIEIHKDLTVTLWDRWDVHNVGKSGLTLSAFVDHIKEKYGIYVREIFKGAQIIYSKSVENPDLLAQSVKAIFQLKTGEHVDITIACTLVDGTDDILKDIPGVRLCNYEAPVTDENAEELEKEQKTPENPELLPIPPQNVISQEPQLDVLEEMIEEVD